MPFIAAAASFYLVACFLVAGVAKMRDFAGFSTSVGEIAPAFASSASILAAAVIGAEIAAAGVLIGSAIDGSVALRQAGGVAALGMAGLFGCAIAIVLLSGNAVECHCFGADDSRITPASLIGPAAITLAGLASLTGARWPEAPPIWAAAVAAGVYLLLLHRAALITFRFFRGPAR